MTNESEKATSFEMVRRVAKALSLEERHTEEDWAFYCKAAKAAIAALREPTPLMINAALRHHLSREKQQQPWNAKLMWDVMIDEAFK